MLSSNSRYTKPMDPKSQICVTKVFWVFPASWNCSFGTEMSTCRSTSGKTSYSSWKSATSFCWFWSNSCTRNFSVACQAKYSAKNRKFRQKMCFKRANGEQGKRACIFPIHLKLSSPSQLLQIFPITIRHGVNTDVTFSRGLKTLFPNKTLRHLGTNEQQLMSCVQRFTILSRLLLDQGDKWILMMKLGLELPAVGRYQGILVIFPDWLAHDFDNHLDSSKVVATEVTTNQGNLVTSVLVTRYLHPCCRKPLVPS